jgi:hypothetical protein
MRLPSHVVGLAYASAELVVQLRLRAEHEVMDPVAPPEELHLREAWRLDPAFQPDVTDEAVLPARFTAAKRTRTMNAMRVFVGTFSDGPSSPTSATSAS